MRRGSLRSERFVAAAVVGLRRAGAMAVASLVGSQAGRRLVVLGAAAGLRGLLRDGRWAWASVEAH